MLERLYRGQVCSIARTLEVVGERWTLLVLRDAFLGVRRYDDFLRRLGVASNVLASRLQLLCEYGILERRRYQERPERFEYVLTDKGRELGPALLALMQWGDRHLAADGPPRLVQHRGCGGQATVITVCSVCGQPLGRDDMESLPGPGAKAAVI
jgi:DNA-binding HxlR family transcriptional regulator